MTVYYITICKCALCAHILHALYLTLFLTITSFCIGFFIKTVSFIAVVRVLKPFVSILVCLYNKFYIMLVIKLPLNCESCEDNQDVAIL